MRSDTGLKVVVDGADFQRVLERAEGAFGAAWAMLHGGKCLGGDVERLAALGRAERKTA